MFYPQTNEAQEVDLGKNRGVVDQFMLLGFGSNSAELKSAYSVTLGGADSVNGEKATRILLVPKDPEILARVKKCELWISDKGLDRTAEVSHRRRRLRAFHLLPHEPEPEYCR